MHLYQNQAVLTGFHIQPSTTTLMTRKTFFAALVAALIGLAAGLTVVTQHASAQQNPNCCSYSVEINGVSAACFPITVKTQWVPGFTDIINYGANGVYWNPIPGPCPPAPPFDWVSLDLGVTQVHLGETKVFHVGGCCYKVKATVNPNFCILITINGC
jgi:hypothetical protein